MNSDAAPTGRTRTPSSCRAEIGRRSVVERLERELGKPVLANNAVSLWAGLRLIKTSGSVPGYGRLLRDHLPHES